MEYGLKQNIIDDINIIFSNYSCIKKAILYGSRAKGNFKLGSDIDLCLFGENINLELIYKIKDDIDDLLLPYLVDIINYHDISNTELKDHINRVGIVFYEK